MTDGNAIGAPSGTIVTSDLIPANRPTRTVAASSNNAAPQTFSQRCTRGSGGNPFTATGNYPASLPPREVKDLRKSLLAARVFTRAASSETIPATCRCDGLLSQHPSKNQRRHDRRVTFNDELRRRRTQFSPRDLLVRNRARVTPIARGRVADLREIPPERHSRALQILMQHRHDADRKVAG